jgi:uncharacterized protein (DUF1499 family)
MVWKVLAVVAAATVLGGVGTLALLSLFARRPGDLGVREGNRLKPCPELPNCVCSQAEDAGHHIDPLLFAGSPEEAMVQLKSALATFPRVQVITSTDRYLHAEFTSLIFRFVDDVEFLLDPAAGVIHWRSASRVGRSDLGVNRKRLEAIRQAFAARNRQDP